MFRKEGEGEQEAANALQDTLREKRTLRARSVSAIHAVPADTLEYEIRFKCVAHDIKLLRFYGLFRLMSTVREPEVDFPNK